MSTFPRRLLVLALPVLLLGGQAAAQPGASFETTFRAFAESHCVHCHGSEVQKAHLRLDQLPPKFADKQTAVTWEKVFDRVTRGEMPPKTQKRPAEKEQQAVVAALEKELTQASRAKQQREGRVTLRRLNRIEYETTLRDLLSTPVEVKDLLPDDNIASGFDKVSAALEISAEHLLRYQEAADKALRSVIPTQPELTIKTRHSGKQITENLKLFQEMLGKSARLDGDTLLVYVRPYGHIPVATAAAPVAGRYRVRISAQALNSGDKPLPLLWTCRPLYGRDDNDVRAVRDVPADRATVLEGEFALKPRETIVFSGWSLPGPREFGTLPQAKKLDSYTGPALAIQWVEIEGPLDAWPPPGYKRLFDDVPLEPRSVAKARTEGRPVPPQPGKRPDNWWLYDPLVMAPTKPRQDAERLLHNFLSLAFRRPVSAEQERYFVKLVHAQLDKGTSFEEAMLVGYKAALCSPHFLFLTEPVAASGELDAHAVATRLAYFLWSSTPDGELLRLAEKEELRKPDVLRAQVERMLKDSKAHRFTANFAGQWLDLRSINATSPDPQVYSEFDDFLFWSMPRETERFFEEVLHADLSLTNFVHSDWTFLNQRLAQHYGIKGIHGGELRKVKLPADTHRGGVLTHASILKVTADGTRTSPVLRGKWVLDKIVGQPPSPPPPDIPTLEPDIRGARTIRQQLDKHRNTPACATCHNHIDPPGFALEGFDVIGGWREFYRGTRGTLVELPNYPGKKVVQGAAVEKGGQTPEGKAFKDVDDYKQLLLADKDQLARNLVHKLLVYATGAELQFADRAVVEQLVASCRAKGYGFRSLIHEVVQSRVFLNK